MTELHPLRCETCNHHIFQEIMKHPHLCDHPKIIEMEDKVFSDIHFVTNEEYERMCILGCASHSATTSAEQVLEIVYPFVSTYDYPENTDWIMMEKIIKPLKEYFLRRECGV